ncbi:MAG: response regulator [Myxococcales bacterium]|nr:response regulator [Myxococcales bacterium]
MENLRARGPFHVLIVDDDVDLRRIYRRHFEDHGYQVSEASDGEEGLNQFAHHDIDLVITDIVMPGVDGIELLKLIKETMHECQVILCSSQATLEHAIEGLNHGAFHLFEKTLPLELLLGAAEQALQQRFLALKNRELRAELLSKNQLLRLSNQELSALNEELHHVVQFYEQVMDGVPQPVVVFQGSDVLFGNQKFREGYSVHAGSLAGRKLDDVLPPAWRDACAQLAERVRAEPQILHQVTLETGTLRLTPIESFDPPRHLLVFEPR